MHVAYAHFHNARLEAGVVRMMARLQFESGVPLPHVPSMVAGDLSSAGIVIDVAGAGGAVQSLDEDESYSLTVTPQLITLQGRDGRRRVSWHGDAAATGAVERERGDHSRSEY